MDGDQQAALQVILGSDPATVGLDNALADRQAQADAFAMGLTRL
jgi:hypothetical protein